jgi:hypothetical protein
VAGWEKTIRWKSDVLGKFQDPSPWPSPRSTGARGKEERIVALENGPARFTLIAIGVGALYFTFFPGKFRKPDGAGIWIGKCSSLS